MGIEGVIVLALRLTELHGPTGAPIWLNPEDVVSMRDVAQGHAGHLAPNTSCLLQTLDGRVVLTSDDCTNARRVLEGGNPP